MALRAAVRVWWVGLLGCVLGFIGGVLGVGPARTSSGVRAGDAYMDFAGVVTAGDEGLLDVAADRRCRGYERVITL